MQNNLPLTPGTQHLAAYWGNYYPQYIGLWLASAQERARERQSGEVTTSDFWAAFVAHGGQLSGVYNTRRTS